MATIIEMQETILKNQIVEQSETSDKGEAKQVNQDQKPDAVQEALKEALGDNIESGSRDLAIEKD